MANLGITANTNLMAGRGDLDGNSSCKPLNVSGDKNNAATVAVVGEPSFRERYPEGRERLLALAESTKSHHQSNSSNALSALTRRSSPFNRHSASPACPSDSSSFSQTPVKPKMGLKDVRNRAAGRWNHVTGVNNRPTVNNAATTTMYASEQSLPEKLSQAIKESLSAAFRGGGTSSHNTDRDGGRGGGGAVAADDVLYFSSSSTSSQGGCGNVELRRPQIGENNTNHKTGLSRSIENLDTCCQGEIPSSRFVVVQNLDLFRAEEQRTKLERPKNLMKVKNCSSYGMNLEDLKKLYRSLPDCSTPVDDEEGEGEMRMGQGRADSVSNECSADVVNNNYQNQRNMTNATVLRLLDSEADVPGSDVRASVPVEEGDSWCRGRFHCNHHILTFNGHLRPEQERQHGSRCCGGPSSAMATVQHGRQPSSDSGTSISADDQRLKSASSSNTTPHHQQAQHRVSAPSGVDFRASCGSPTDSGYQSVPRNEDLPDQSNHVTGLPPSGHAALVTSRTQLYKAVPKSVFAITGTHLQQCCAGGERVKVSESATCNILITPNNNGCGASAAAALVAAAADAAGRRQKTRPKHGSAHGIRMGSAPPPIHDQNNANLRHSLDDAVATRNPPCQSPYSDLSSPNYGTSTTTSSSGASSAAAAAARAASQHANPVVSKIDGTQNQLQQNATNGGGASFDTINTNVSLPEEFSLDRCPKLIDLDRIPWTEKDIVTVLQKGRTRSLVNQIAIDVVPRLTYLLQRPLIRIAREAQRLCQRFNKCTKSDIHYATRIIFPSIIGDSCQKAALQATAMFMMGGESLKQSKSHRSGLRGLSVGKFQRWMCDAQLASCTLDQAAVYLTAVMENLLEEIVLQSMPQHHQHEGDVVMLTSEYLEIALANNVELWGLLQPCSHLICSRTANGILGLPQSSRSPSREGPPLAAARRLSLQQQPKDCRVQHDLDCRGGNNGTLLKNLEQCLLATCVGSINELSELINRVLHHHSKTGSTPSLSALTGCGSVGQSSVGKQAAPIWSKDALRTLFYFMRCSQLEQADNPHSSPPAVILAHERPYLVLPPLVEWLRVSHAHTDHRQACLVDSDDVLQAARVLLPGLDCPPRPFGLEDSSPVNGRASPQTCGQRLKADLAYRMLTSGNLDQAAQAINLLGTQNLNTPNDQGLTPLMWACYQNDDAAVRVLLDAGVIVNVSVTSSVNVSVTSATSASYQKANLTLLDLVGWTALTFAVAQKNYALAHLLLERGANVESPNMHTETPLQIAAMMGHHDLVNLLTSKGADPFYATATPDAGFKQRGCASPLSLAAAHGHRTVVQAMFSRRRGRSEEVLSLEDFLAEGIQSPTSKTAQSVPCSKSSLQLNNQQVAASPAAAWLGKLTKSQQKILQDAMYQAAECGHVDITMDLRHLGIPWNSHIWTQTLSTAHELRRKALVQLLLGDFIKYRLDDVNQEFIDDCLPLLIEIFRQSKNEVSTGQLAEILCHLYGDEAVPPIGGLLSSSAIIDENPMAPRIDAKYVNNPDLSDIQFLIDDRVFYGHKIVLINASDRFKRLIQDGSATVEVEGVRYEIFQMMMEFLYNGKPTIENTTDLSTLSQLLCAAGEFGLRSLRLHCEALISRCLNAENCVDIYRFALRNDAVELMRYCEGYFLQNLPTLINQVDGYRRLMMCNHGANSSLLISSSSTELNKSSNASASMSSAFDLADALLQTLTERLQQRMQHCSKKL